MTLYSFIGIACTSAAEVVFGDPIWNAVTLLGRFHHPFFAFLGLISILIATLICLRLQPSCRDCAGDGCYGCVHRARSSRVASSL